VTVTAERPERMPAALPETPYVGLVPFREEDAPFFFGRERERKIVTANLRAARLTLLYGPSGVGKSSLLRAGVVSGLRARTESAQAVAVVSSWRDDPLLALTEAVRAAVSDAVGEEIDPPDPEVRLVDTLREWSAQVRRILVVLDQFEDYFLYHADEDGDGTLFAELPRVVNEPNLRANVLLSLREDAVARLDRFEGRIPNLFGNYLRVDYLTTEGAREAIEKPLGEYNRRLPPDEPQYTVEPALVDAVVAAAASGRLGLAAEANGSLAEDSAAGKVETPFLQLVMERLWRATVAAGSHELTTARLEALGGAQQIVENHLFEALGSLDSAEQGVAADLFRFLVSRSRTKIAHSASDLAEWTKRPEPEVAAVLDKLCRGESGRLLRALPPPEGDDDAARYELFHDVLGEPIVEWRRRFEHDRDRRRTIRRFAVVAGGLVALVAAFAALGIWALVQRNDANRATQSATSIALASASTRQLATRPDESLLLGLDAVDAKSTPQARGSMISALVGALRSGVETILHGHDGAVYGVAFSRDGHTVASGGADGTVRLWDLQAHRALGILDGHAAINGVAFSPDGRVVASAGEDGTVRLWDTHTERSLGVLEGTRGTQPLNGVAFSPNGHTIAAAGGDGTVRLWDVRARRSVVVLDGQAAVNAVAFAPDGRTLAAAGDDGTVRLLIIGARQPPVVLPGRSDSVRSVAFSPDGRHLASAGDDKMVHVWDVSTHRLLEILRGHEDAVDGVAFNPDGSTVATAGSDQTVRIWNMRSRRAKVLSGHIGPVYGVAWSRDGHTLASAGDDQTVRIWDTRRPAAIAVLPRSTGGNIQIAFSPDGGTIASALVDKTVRVWDTRTHRQVHVFSGHTGPVYGVAYSLDGRTLASASQDRTVRLWDLRTGDSTVLRGHRGSVFKVAFSPDRHTLASTSEDDTVRLWNLGTHRTIAILKTKASADGVAFSPDGSLLAAGTHDGTVWLWSARTHKRIDVLTGHAGPVYGIAFSPDGRILATSGADKTVRLWDTRTFEALSVLPGHSDVVWKVAFSPDGSMFASASQDRTVRLWDTRTRQLLDVIRGKDNANSTVFSPDGRLLAIAYYASVQLWSGVLWRGRTDLRRQVCGLVVGNLSRPEWAGLASGLPYRTACPG